MSTQQEDWAAEYYRRKRREGKSHTVAVRALASQWMLLIYALWRKREVYDPAIFLAAQQSHTPRGVAPSSVFTALRGEHWPAAPMADGLDGRPAAR